MAIGQYNQMVILTWNQIGYPLNYLFVECPPQRNSATKNCSQNFGQMIDKNFDNTENKIPY